MSVRSDVVDALRPLLPTSWDVRTSAPADIGNITRVTVLPQTTTLASPARFESWQMTLVLDVVSPVQAGTGAEDVLDAALERTLEALTTSKLVALVAGAERIVRGEKHQAWRFTLNIPLNISTEE